jgi:hypothetical protein
MRIVSKEKKQVDLQKTVSADSSAPVEMRIRAMEYDLEALRNSGKTNMKYSIHPQTQKKFEKKEQEKKKKAEKEDEV